MPPAQNLQTAKKLHIFLITGILGTQIFFAVLYSQGIATIDAGDLPGGFGSILAGAGIMALGLGIVFRGRVPQVKGGDSIESHWLSPAVHAAAGLAWFSMEGAAMISGVGFLLTGETAPAIVSGAALVAIVVSPPRRLTPET